MIKKVVVDINKNGNRYFSDLYSDVFKHKLQRLLSAISKRSNINIPQEDSYVVSDENDVYSISVDIDIDEISLNNLPIGIKKHIK